MKKKFEVSDHLLASHGQRFLHRIIDVIMIYILVIVFAAVTTLVALLLNPEAGNIFENISDGVSMLIFILISIIYYLIFEGFFSRSVAKFITNTIVVNEDGSEPDFLTILKRTLCRFIPFDAFSYLGGQSRGWHDSIPNVYVVRRKDFEQEKELFYSFDEIGKQEEQIN